MRVASCHEQMNFKAGGYLLVVSVDLFEVSKEDREFAMGIVDQVREYIIKSGGQTSFQPRRERT